MISTPEWVSRPYIIGIQLQAQAVSGQGRSSRIVVTRNKKENSGKTNDDVKDARWAVASVLLCRLISLEPELVAQKLPFSLHAPAVGWIASTRLRSFDAATLPCV